MNYQAMWILLKDYINSKNSHGKNELLKHMDKLEIDEVKSICNKYSSERKGK